MLTDAVAQDIATLFVFSTSIDASNTTGITMYYLSRTPSSTSDYVSNALACGTEEKNIVVQSTSRPKFIDSRSHAMTQTDLERLRNGTRL